MSTTNFSGLPSRKVPSTKVAAPPGGKSSFNLFGGPDALPPTTPQKGVGMTKARTNTASGTSPFATNGQSEPKKSSRVVNPKTGTWKASRNSPFSTEPMLRRGRQSSRVNLASANSPWAPLTDNEAPKPGKPSPGLKTNDANPLNHSAAYTPPKQTTRATATVKTSSDSPFSDAPYNPPSQPRRSSMTMQQSDQSPFVDASQQAPIPAQKPSLKLTQQPGGNQSFNVFDQPKNAPQQPKRTVNNPTYQNNVNSPFYKGQAPKPKPRPQPKANQISQSHPFSTAPMPQSKPRVQPKANVPDANSPFSKAPPPSGPRRNSQVHQQSQNSPFTGGTQFTTNSGQTKNGPSVRIHQRPGGNTSFNIFGGQ